MKTGKVEKAKGREVYRQGDVLFFKIPELPKEAEIKSNALKIEGENGHTHLMQSVVVATKGQQTCIEVQQPTEILHEEHGTLLVPQGIYQVRQTRSYLRKVGD
jgi:hypothetical protein